MHSYVDQSLLYDAFCTQV